MRGNWGNGLTKEQRRAIGYRIAEIRGDEKASDFAKRLGVHDSMVCNWISGTALPTLGNLINLCRKTGRSADEILGVK